MSQRRWLLFFVALWALLSLACSGLLGGQSGGENAPIAPPSAGQTGGQSGGQAGPQVGGMGNQTGPMGGSQPTGGGRPARSFQEAENAVVKIVATGTLALLEAGGEVVYNVRGIGTGFIIDPSGIVVTNNHVSAGAATLKVYIGGDIQQEFPARVLAASECMDLAVLKIDAPQPFPVYLEWYTGPVEVGMEVYAAGYPGLGDDWQYALTKGIISKTHESGEMNWAYLDYAYLHDARIRKGNSGGPLITPQGQVVGINYAGGDELDVNLAIPAELARPIVEQYLRQGKPYRWVGINGEALVVPELDFSGIWVASVESGSPADKLGIKPGDILFEVENIAVALRGTMKEYCDILASRGPNDAIKVKVLRLETGEVLEGTLNSGEPLKVIGTLDGGGTASDTGSTGGQGGTTGGGAPTGDYTIITDDTGAIAVQVPTAWTAEVDGGLWNTTWTKNDGSTYNVVAASVVAAPNLAAFNELNGPGVWVAASRDFGRIGGYAQLLEGTEGWFTSCTPADWGDYEDTLYEGAYKIWERCGDYGNIASVVVTVRPKANPTAYLVLVVINVDPTSGNAVEILKSVLDSFEVVGTLP